MKIAIDLDQTLFYNDVVDNVIKEFNIKPEVKYTWGLNELGEDVKKECFKRFSDPRFMCSLKPIRGNKVKVKQWDSEGHKLYCVTSRDVMLTKQTVDMVTQHYPQIKNIVIVSGFDKTSTYAFHKFDVIIDDNPNNINQAYKLKRTKKIYFISNKNTPYNFDSLNDFKRSKRVVVVNGLSQIDL